MDASEKLYRKIMAAKPWDGNERRRCAMEVECKFERKIMEIDATLHGDGTQDSLKRSHSWILADIKDFVDSIRKFIWPVSISLVCGSMAALANFLLTLYKNQ